MVTALRAHLTAGLGTCIVLSAATLAATAPAAAALHEKVLYDFGQPPDGAAPQASLVADAGGNLYGTTLGGGNGYGTVFKLTRSSRGYVESVIYAFSGADGALPFSSAIVDGRGIVYGTTSGGGAYGEGVAFALTPSAGGYIESVLHNFGKYPDASTPYAPLIEDGRGNLFGTTEFGGPPCSCGAVFELTPSASGYAESVIHTFGDRPDGQAPDGGLLEDAQGRLFGTTSGGGRHGLGTVFALTPSASGYRETILHSFSGYPHDGNEPLAALIEDGGGDLYGTTAIGGDGRCADSGIRFGCGSVFELRPAAHGYASRLLHSFHGPDGLVPYSTLVADSKGNLYGTTTGGAPGVNGVVFRLRPAGSGYVESTVFRMRGQSDGGTLYGGLTLFGDTFFGTAAGGGTTQNGVVFSLRV